MGEVREVKHKKLGIDLILPELNQTKIEQLETELGKYLADVENADNIQAAVYSGSIVRAACDAGWITAFSSSEVEGMKPPAVKYLSNEVGVHLLENRKYSDEDMQNEDYDFPEITQGQLEKYETLIAKKTENIQSIQLSVYSGAIVRSSIESGWLEGNIDEVGLMEASDVSKKAFKIANYIKSIKQVPLE